MNEKEAIYRHYDCLPILIGALVDMSKNHTKYGAEAQKRASKALSDWDRARCLK